MMYSTTKPNLATRKPLVLKLLVLAASAVLLYLSYCSEDPKLPRPPLIYPFDTQQAGFKIETDFRVVDFHAFSFGFRLGFKEDDAADRARVQKLAGVSAAVRIHIHARKPSTLESTFDKTFFEQEMTAYGATSFRTEITSVRLKPGTYHLVIENLKEVPELHGTPVTLVFAESYPLGTSISD